MAEALASAMGKSPEKSLGLDDILSNIKKAKNNPDIKGIYLKGGTLQAGMASVKEIRDALTDFKKSGKFIVAYSDNYTQKMYYLASVANKLLVNPQGMVELKGLSAELMFFKNTLDKLGIDMQVVRVGSFKSAVEPFINTKMSDANRLQMNVYMNSIWSNLLSQVSESRKIPVDLLNKYADEMMMFQPATKLKAYHLVDDLVYSDKVGNIIKAYTKDDYNTIKHSAMTKVADNVTVEKTKIALIYAAGDIDNGDDDGIVSKDLVETIQKVAKDESVKAVVFRVNSPGGSAYGSEQIWHALAELKAKKPLVVSMGDYAASGGYYISCVADEIVAQPNTVTGSIGIFGLIPNISGLNEKLGLTYDVVKTNKMSDAISVNRAFTPEERGLIQAYINQGYELFVKRCADGRKKTTDEIKAIAEGRVWTGADALKIGLVDKLGGLPLAISEAAKKAKLTNYNIKEYPEKEDFATKFLKNFGEDAETSVLKARLGDQYVIYKRINKIQQMKGIQAMLPFEMDVQ